VRLFWGPFAYAPNPPTHQILFHSRNEETPFQSFCPSFCSPPLALYLREFFLPLEDVLNPPPPPNCRDTFLFFPNAAPCVRSLLPLCPLQMKLLFLTPGKGFGMNHPTPAPPFSIRLAELPRVKLAPFSTGRTIPSFPAKRGSILVILISLLIA